jgi:hypothetical protein
MTSSTWARNFNLTELSDITAGNLIGHIEEQRALGQLFSYKVLQSGTQFTIEGMFNGGDGMVETHSRSFSNILEQGSKARNWQKPQVGSHFSVLESASRSTIPGSVHSKSTL